ncbi:heme exporter protein CcmD [Allosphingosinicella sp.]
MNHWPFILGAYGATAALTVPLLWWSWRAMRRAEAEAERSAPGR